MPDGTDARNGEGYERMKRIAMIMEAGKRAFASTRAAWFLKKMREEGKFREFGVSLHDTPEFLDQILTEHLEINFLMLLVWVLRRLMFLIRIAFLNVVVL